MDRKEPNSTETTDSTKNSGFLENQLLIAMPGLLDPYFNQTVTLICQQNENGCFGLTINRPTQVTIDELFDQLEIPNTNESVKGKLAFSGGPVQSEQGFVIHDADNKWENTIKINEEIAVTASRDILFDIAKGDGPDNFILTLGCASWAPGQMEAEFKSNSWLNCDADKKILFNTPYDKCWNGAVDALGIDIGFMSEVAGHD